MSRSHGCPSRRSSCRRRSRSHGVVSGATCSLICPRHHQSVVTQLLGPLRLSLTQLVGMERRVNRTANGGVIEGGGLHVACWTLARCMMHGCKVNVGGAGAAAGRALDPDRAGGRWGLKRKSMRTSPFAFGFGIESIRPLAARVRAGVVAVRPLGLWTIDSRSRYRYRRQARLARGAEPPYMQP
jgi:hypothetical protein